MYAFLTGSMAYGTPREDSDIDVVMRVGSWDMVNSMAYHADESGSFDEYVHQTSMRYGKLNVILCFTDNAYEAWRRGTEELIARKPVTRQEAVDTFKRLFAELGVE